MTDNQSSFIEKVGGFRFICNNQKLFSNFLDWFQSEFGREPYAHNENDIKLYKAFQKGYFSR